MGEATTTSPAPDARFLVSHPAHFIALGFGCGLAPYAKGTVGTLMALALYWGLATFLPAIAIAFLAIPMFFIGVWACEITGATSAWRSSLDGVGRDRGVPAARGARRRQPRFAGAHVRALSPLRYLEAVPDPQLERQLKGGIGVMADDLAAACYAYVAFIIGVVVAHKAMGIA
jgi:phosphatidylglycerophosphatase A